jgi:putative inorganic carbon (HCO3(-)) transporter
MSVGVVLHPVPRGTAVAGVIAAAALLGATAAARPVAILLGVLLVLGAAVLTAWPEATTPLVVFLLYVNIPAALVNSYGLPRTAGAVVPLLLVVPLAFHLYRRGRIVVDRTLLLLLVYFAVQVGSTFLSTEQGVATQALLTFALEGVVVYFLVTNVVRTRAALRHAVWAIVAGAALLSTLTTFQHLSGTFWRSYGGLSFVDSAYYYGQVDWPRAAGPIGDPNYYGQILLVGLALALLACWGERVLRWRLLAAASATLIAIAITFTYSRGAALAFGLLLATMVLLRYVGRRQLLVVVIGAVVLLLVFPGYRSRVATVMPFGDATSAESSMVEASADQSTEGRATEMLAAALVFSDHPLLGVGPQVSPAYYQEYAAGLGAELHDSVRYGPNRGEQPQRESHNIVLSVAADVGLAGLLVFAAIVLDTLVRLARARRRRLPTRPELASLATAFLLAVVAYVIAGMFLSLAFERYFWLLIALAGAAASRDLERDAGDDGVAT